MKELKASIARIAHDVHNPRDLNLERGRKYQKFAKTGTRAGKIGLKENSEATVKIQGKSHPPMAHKKQLIKHVNLKVKGQSTEVGFFRSDVSKPKDSKLTYFTLAKIHKTGYRIPLTGEKGRKVRAWLAAHGIFVRKSKTHLVVPARDIIGNSISHYLAKPTDDRIIKKWFDKLWRNI